MKPLRRTPALPHQHRRIRSLGIERENEPYFFGYDEGPAGDDYDEPTEPTDELTDITESC